MQKTSNYNLNKPEVTDPLRVADFNANADLIDAALNSLNTALGSKAEKSAVTAVESALGNKANAADLTALSQTVSALSSDVSGKGNCRIATGSYVGTGTYGPDNPNTLTFDFKPLWVMIARSGLKDTATVEPTSLKTSVMVRSLRAASSTYGNGLLVTWTDKGVSWYCDSGITNAAQGQNNTLGYTHYWVALGVSE